MSAGPLYENYVGAADPLKLMAETPPEFGPISVGWIIRTVAGHDLHHLAQLERIGAL